jgi:hypothetical protein
METHDLPTPSQVRGVLPFIHHLEKQREWIDRCHTLSRTPSEPIVVSRLRRALDLHGVILEDFDWGEWDDGYELAGDFRAIASADLRLLCRMVTAHVRADRFVRGHFHNVCRNGVMWAILRRMEQLVEGGAAVSGSIHSPLASEFHRFCPGDPTTSCGPTPALSHAPRPPA